MSDVVMSYTIYEQVQGKLVRSVNNKNVYSILYTVKKVVYRVFLSYPNENV